jgi:uncharacterized protein (TIGR02594 family)
MKDKLEVKIKYGGVPILSEIIKLGKTAIKTDLNTNSIGLDYGEVGESEVSGYFKDMSIEADNIEGVTEQSYEYALNTARVVNAYSNHQNKDFEKIEKPKELSKWTTAEIQTVLNEFGFSLDVDGIYGIMTHTAIVNFGVDFLREELEMHYPRDTLSFVDEIPYIATAKSELGIKEWNTGDNPEVTKYHDSVNDLHWGDNVPWCASFVTWVMKKNGYSVPRYSARAKSWLEFGRSAGIPAYGAIAVKSRRGGGHVCFVVGATNDGKYLYCLGGNQHDEVCISKYRKEVFLDFRVPNDYNYNIPLVDIAEAQNFGMAGREN